MACGWDCGNWDMHLEVFTHHCCSGAMPPTVFLFSFYSFWQFFKVRVGSHFLFATRFATCLDLLHGSRVDGPSSFSPSSDGANFFARARIL